MFGAPSRGATPRSPCYPRLDTARRTVGPCRERAGAAHVRNAWLVLRPAVEEDEYGVQRCDTAGNSRYPRKSAGESASQTPEMTESADCCTPLNVPTAER
jgi:hypothetical protein